MKTSNEGIRLIKKFEGCSLKAYKLRHKGGTEEHCTIGYGHYGADVKEGQRISKAEAEELLKRDLVKFENKVNKYHEQYNWSQNEFDALVSYCYNIGNIKGLTDSGRRTRQEIAADWLNHNKAKGVVLAGLTRRRRTELELFVKGGEHMNEKDIIICGHGSGTPRISKMDRYMEYRYKQNARNGKSKGVVKVMRLKTLTDRDRIRCHDLYKTILGRNRYSQALREYCYTPYKGMYYSDCSSSGIKTFNKLGYKTQWTLNTAAIYTSKLFEEVPVVIKDGHIVNPEILKVFDCILFKGDDPSRPLQIGHVEYIYELPEKTKETGWTVVDDKWYYKNIDGTVAKGWKKIKSIQDGNTYWYYFKSDGSMAHGWQYINKAWYYLEGSGNFKGALWHTDQYGVQKRWIL